MSPLKLVSWWDNEIGYVNLIILNSNKMYDMTVFKSYVKTSTKNTTQTHTQEPEYPEHA